MKNRFIALFLTLSIILIHSAHAETSSYEIYIDQIATAIYENALISSKAGKYPTVSFKAIKSDLDGLITSKEDILIFANDKILSFLVEFQKFCNDKQYHFEDLRFNIYTTFFDESATVETTSGMIFAFSISYDTVLRQDFNRITINELFDTGFNQYVHPIFQ